MMNCVGSKATFILVVLMACGMMPANGQTEGLFGEYFGSTQMSILLATRVDSQVYFDWGTGSPHPYLAVDNFSVCWTGFVTPVEGGDYTFYITSDDGVRLWIDNTMVVNQWKGQSPTEYSATATLSAGQPYPIRIDYFENSGGAVVKLEWEGPGITREAIPASVLTPGTGVGDRALDWLRNPDNGHYYKIIGPLTWAAGKEQAEAMGGYLAVIDDAAEDQWIVGMFRPVSDVGFTGANDINTEGVWVWDYTGQNFWNGASDGTAVSGFYTKWGTGEPNNSNDEDVATIHLDSGVWNDLNVARERYCVVESDAGQLNFDGPFPANKIVGIDGRYEVSVSVRNPVGTVQYQWYRNNTAIPGAVSSTLKIDHVSYTDAGLYTCQVADETPASGRTGAAKLTVVEEMPALTASGLAGLAALLALTAVRRKRK